MYNQIINYVESNNILHIHQFGFRSGKSTSDAVVSFVNICTECFERREYCATLFLDLTSAFDCVSHALLLQKLRLVHKFDNNSLAMIRSYLSQRKQQVTCGRQASSCLEVKRGVPQGSILGPLLFLLFFNDFPQVVEAESIRCLLYADDATILVYGKNYDMVQDRCTAVLGNIRDWCFRNELCLNESKTVRMLFTLRSLDFVNPEACRFLGVYVSAPDLKFDEHARHVGTRISRNLFLLRSLTKTVSLDVAITAYHALIQSHINYSILAWGNSYASAYVFKLQRRAIRVLSGLGYRECCRDAFVGLAIMTLPSVYILESIMYASKSFSQFRSCSDVHMHDTRSKSDVYVRYCRLGFSQRAPVRMCQVLI